MKVATKLGLCSIVVVAGAFGLLSSLAAQPRSLAIRAGRILDVKTGTYQLQQMIWIEGDRIAQIGPVNTISRQLPAGTQVMDLSTETLLPGLIDAHTHLTVSPESIAARSQSPAANADVPGHEPTELAKR